MNCITKLLSAEKVTSVSDNDKKTYFRDSNQKAFDVFYKFIGGGTFVAMIAIIA